MVIRSTIVLFLLSINLLGFESSPLRSEKKSNEIDFYVPLDFYVPYADFSIEMNDNSDELGDYFEGDMILNDDQAQALNEEPDHERTGPINTRYRWTTTIAYELDPGFTTLQMAHIILGMADIESSTCLTFKPKTETDDDYIFFNSDATGCSSIVGRQDGQNRVSLKPDNPGSGCFKHGTIVHEIIHALGFYHMQSASDRDQFVEIVWENIIPGKENNFKYYDDSLITNFGIPYDYNSVMHYSMTAFTVNGNYTIIPLDSDATDLGQRLTMTESDIERLKAMYCMDLESESELDEEPIGEGPEPEQKYYDDSLITHFGIPYDYNSVIHYSMAAFTGNDNYTTIPLDSDATDIVQRLTMPESDIDRLNAVYCMDLESESELDEKPVGEGPEPEQEENPNLPYDD